MCVLWFWFARGVCLWLCFGVEQLFSYRTCKKVEFGPAKMADFCPLITKNASLNGPNVNRCAKSPCSLGVAHVLTIRLVLLGDAQQMGAKCVMLYLSRVANYFFSSF